MIFDRLAPYYDQFVDQDLNDIYIKYIDKFGIKGTVIDLGTGTGPLAVDLAQKGYFVTATDISTEMLERANNNAVLANVKIHFFIHNIIDPLRQVYDNLIMSSDVINYLNNKEDVLQSFQNIGAAMHENSIFIFDFIHITYVDKIHNFHQDILLDDDVLQWRVQKTNIPNQIKHTLRFGREIETHVQTTFPAKEYRQLLHDAGLTVIKRKRTDERVIFVCKRK